MRLAKPVAQHAVFRDAIQDAVRTDDGGIHGAGQNQGADNHDEPVENQPRPDRPLQAHGQAADQVFEEALAHIIGNNHHREKRNQRGEHQAVHENYQPGFAQILELGAFDFAIHLREGFFAAHGQHGMAERDEDSDDAEHVRKTAVRQPTQSIGPQAQIMWRRPRRQRGVPHDHGVNAPGDQHNHHYGDQLHDMKSFFAGFGNALGVFPPEVHRHDDGKSGGNNADRSGGQGS